MGTLFQNLSFVENKTNTPGNGGLHFEIPFFSTLFHNKMQFTINLWLLALVFHTAMGQEKQEAGFRLEKRRCSNWNTSVPSRLWKCPLSTCPFFTVEEPTFKWILLFFHRLVTNKVFKGDRKTASFCINLRIKHFYPQSNFISTRNKLNLQLENTGVEKNSLVQSPTKKKK